MSEKILEDVYQLYLSSIEIYNYAQDQAKKDYSVAHKFNIQPKSNKKKYLNAIQQHFDRLKTDLEEFYILNIITTFEGIVFRRIQQTRGDIEKIIDKRYGQRIKDKEKIYFHRSAKSFLKSDKDIFSLGRAIKLLEKQIKDIKLFDDLEKIRDHRDYLSHGKRINVGKESQFSIEEIKDKLIAIVDSI